MPNDREISVPQRALELIRTYPNLPYSDAKAAVLAMRAIRLKGGSKPMDVKNLSKLDPPLRLAARTVCRFLVLAKDINVSHLLKELDRLDALDARVPQSWTRAPEPRWPWQPPQPRGVFTLSEWRQKAVAQRS